jgi:hypothetical protein
MDWNTAYVLRQVANSFHKRLAFFAKFCHSVATVSDSFNKESPNGGGVLLLFRLLTTRRLAQTP